MSSSWFLPDVAFGLKSKSFIKVIKAEQLFPHTSECEYSGVAFGFFWISVRVAVGFLVTSLNKIFHGQLLSLAEPTVVVSLWLSSSVFHFTVMESTVWEYWKLFCTLDQIFVLKLFNSRGLQRVFCFYFDLTFTVNCRPLYTKLLLMYNQLNLLQVVQHFSSWFLKKICIMDYCGRSGQKVNLIHLKGHTNTIYNTIKCKMWKGLKLSEPTVHSADWII